MQYLHITYFYEKVAKKLQHIYFVEPNEKGKFGINLNSMESIFSCLKKEEAIGMQDEFHLINDDADVKHIFGHCLYTLVATRDGKWRDKCSIYKDLQILVQNPK